MNYLDMLCESIDRAYERFERLFEGVSLLRRPTVFQWKIEPHKSNQ